MNFGCDVFLIHIRLLWSLIYMICTIHGRIEVWICELLWFLGDFWEHLGSKEPNFLVVHTV